MAGAPRCQITLPCLGILMMLGTIPLSAQQRGTVRVDDETHSFIAGTCGLLGPQMALAGGTDDDGNLILIEMETQAVNIMIVYLESGRGSRTLTARYDTEAGDDPTSSREPAPELSVQLDGSPLTASGTFVDTLTREKHAVDISVDCTG